MPIQQDSLDEEIRTLEEILALENKLYPELKTIASATAKAPVTAPVARMQEAPTPVVQPREMSGVERAFTQPYQTIAERTLGETTAKYLKPITYIPDLVAGRVGGGLLGSYESGVRGLRNIREGNVGTGALQLAISPIRAAGATFGITPPGATFNVATGILEDIPVVGDITRGILSPAQTIFEPKTEAGQAGAELVDAIFQAGLLAKSPQIERSILKGTKEIVRPIAPPIAKYLTERAQQRAAKTQAEGLKLAGEIAQTKTMAQQPKVVEAIKQIDVKGVKTFPELKERLDTAISDKSGQLDAMLEAKSGAKKLSELDLKTKVAEKTVSHNFVDDAIRQLEDFYNKVNDVEGVEIVNQYKTKANNEGLTVKDLNDIARLHGKDLNAFNVAGELASGLSKRAAENTRIGLKETARKEFGGKEYEQIDKDISSLIATRDAIDKLNETANRIRQNTKKPGLSDYIAKAGNLIFHIFTLGTGKPIIKTAQHILLKGTLAGKTGRMDAVELEKGLSKRLKELQSIANKNIPESVLVRKLEGFLGSLGYSKNDIRNFPVSPEAVAEPAVGTSPLPSPKGEGTRPPTTFGEKGTTPSVSPPKGGKGGEEAPEIGTLEPLPPIAPKTAPGGAAVERPIIEPAEMEAIAPETRRMAEPAAFDEAGVRERINMAGSQREVVDLAEEVMRYDAPTEKKLEMLNAINEKQNELSRKTIGEETGVLQEETTPVAASETKETSGNIKVENKDIKPIKDDKLQTPLKDKYQNRLDNLDTTNKQTDIKTLDIGDYILVSDKSGNKYEGFIKKIGNKNAIIETPYGGWGKQDYIYIQELTFPKSNIEAFYKPKAEGKIKQEWEMTPEEYVRSKIGTTYKDSFGRTLVNMGLEHELRYPESQQEPVIARALAEGKNVPKEIVARQKTIWDQAENILKDKKSSKKYKELAKKLLARKSEYVGSESVKKKSLP